MPKLLLATNNKAKVREYKHLLKGLAMELVSLADEGITTRVSEVGGSLEENARLKATTIARESGLLVMADDSGLEVDVLGGSPARFQRAMLAKELQIGTGLTTCLPGLRECPGRGAQLVPGVSSLSLRLMAEWSSARVSVRVILPLSRRVKKALVMTRYSISPS